MASKYHPLALNAFRLGRLALCLATAAAPPLAALAQTAATDAAAPTSVVITGRTATAAAAVGGFGDVPLSRSPLQASVTTQEQLRDGGGTGLAALTRYDASISDAYNADGYWTTFAVRGMAIDNRYNFLRDGLPINGETSLPLDNKARVEVLKGTSGIQAGTSAPGGLVNLVVKRPEGNQRSAGIGWRQDGTASAWADLGQRFGTDGAFGVRLNVVAEALDPQVRDDRGRRSLVALAGDWRPIGGTLIEAEVESSRQSQRSVPGFSLLGPVLPSASNVDPRINLNNQPWSLPVVLEGNTGSLRLHQQLAGDWQLVAHAAVQKLHSDDRLAYAYGCSKEGNYDRYCSDGSFDFYDFRSDGERRQSTALDAHVQGRLATGAWVHELTAGALATRFTLRTQPQADDSVIVGSGTVDGLTLVPSLPADLGTIANTNRTERSTELYARDRLQLSEALGMWLGLRHTQLHRASVQTDGSQATDYPQSFTTPWLAGTWAPSPEALVYASWGQGVESAVAPNRPGYTNPGQPLPALKSRQIELGMKKSTATLSWGLTGFDIRQPQFDDVSAGCDVNPAACITTRRDGTLHNRGLEAQLRWTAGSLTLQGSAMVLRATLGGNSDAALNGRRPTNVPDQTLKLGASHAVAGLPGLRLQAGLVYEGSREVLPDNSLHIPGWTRWDLGARYQTRVGTTALTWQLGLDNATNRRAWRESPYQYQHVYLFPLAPRTWRASMQVDL